MKLPFVSRRKHDRLVAELVAARETEKQLRYRLFVLRDGMKEAKRRVRMNIRLTDNAAAYSVLDQKLIADLEKDVGPERETS